MNIVMLNLLIALMGGSYERVAETAKLVTLRNRAELILQYEMRMTNEETNIEQWHPTFLHALVPADDVEEELDEADAGVINGVKRLMVTERTKATKQAADGDAKIQAALSTQANDINLASQQMDKKMEGMSGKIEGLESKLVQIDAMQGQMNATMVAILKKLEDAQPQAEQKETVQ